MGGWVSAHVAYLCSLVFSKLNSRCTISILMDAVGPVHLHDLMVLIESRYLAQDQWSSISSLIGAQ